MEFKKCFKCCLEKSISEFYKHKAMADGHLNKCKSCAKSDVLRHRSENIEKVREYDRMRGNRHPEGYLKDYRQKYPSKHRAHDMVNNAIRVGSLVKQPCEVCGSEFSVHAHHDDYDKPLDVRWLCSMHHRQWHVENGPGINAEINQTQGVTA